MLRTRNTTALSLVIAISMAASSAYAQTSQVEPEDKDYELDTVVVTASKTGAQELQSVPLAVQAFSGEDLKVRNINTIDDLISSVPGAYEGQRQSVASMRLARNRAKGSAAPAAATRTVIHPSATTSMMSRSS